MAKQTRQSRARNDEPIPTLTSTEDVLGWIDRRIGLMQNLRAAVLSVAGMSKGASTSLLHTITQQAHMKAKHPWNKGKMRAGTTRALIIKTLSAGPLGTEELFQRLQRRGWQTSSANPKALLGVTMRALEQKRLVHRVGADWELSVKTAKQLAAVPEDTSSLDTSITQ